MRCTIYQTRIAYLYVLRLYVHCVLATLHIPVTSVCFRLNLPHLLCIQWKKTSHSNAIAFASICVRIDCNYYSNETDCRRQLLYNYFLFVAWQKIAGDYGNELSLHRHVCQLCTTSALMMYFNGQRRQRNASKLEFDHNLLIRSFFFPLKPCLITFFHVRANFGSLFSLEVSLSEKSLWLMLDV